MYFEASNQIGGACLNHFCRVLIVQRVYPDTYIFFFFSYVEKLSYERGFVFILVISCFRDCIAGLSQRRSKIVISTDHLAGNATVLSMIRKNGYLRPLDL